MNTYQPRSFAEALYTPTPNLISPPINQAASWRLEGMKSVIGEFKRPINALEIGVWYGEGSTKVWLDALIEKSSITLIDFWKPYCSDKDKQDSAFDYQKMDNMTHEAFINTINVVRKYEAKKDLNITIIRGSSKDYLKNFIDIVCHLFEILWFIFCKFSVFYVYPPKPFMAIYFTIQKFFVYGK